MAELGGASASDGTSDGATTPWADLSPTSTPTPWAGTPASGVDLVVVVLHNAVLHASSYATINNCTNKRVVAVNMNTKIGGS